MMLRKMACTGMLVGLAVLLFAGPVLAQDGGDAKGKELAKERYCGLCEAKGAMYEAVPWLKWSLDFRAREIFAPRLTFTSEDRHFQRYRIRAGATVTPIENLDFNVRLVYEPRHYCDPDREFLMRNQKIIDEWTLNEMIIDKLNIAWSQAFGLPLKFVVGRQDIVFGDGWLVLDGTPLDGSRTIHFDAVRGTYEWADCQTTFDAIFICQKADSDYWLPPTCAEDYHNREQDEKGVILYVSNKSWQNTVIDGYFIYKHDTAELMGGETGIAPWQGGTDADLFTIGACVAMDLDENWKALVEAAPQFGNRNSQQHLAFGGKARLAYHLNDAWNNDIHCAYEYLSGDNPGTAQSEQFDQLWGRWPQFSELYVYPTARETRVGEVVNMHRVNVGWGFHPMEDLDCSFDYHVLFRDQDYSNQNGRTNIAGGCVKGHLLAAVAKYRFNEHISTHVLGEIFFPGGYWNDSANEVAGFFRWEVAFGW